MIGIAVGSQSSVVGLKKGAGVDIVLSITSKRDVPTMVTFGAKERSYGSQSQDIMKSNISTTIIYPPRFLGLQPDWDNGKFLEQEAKFSLASPTVDSLLQRVAFDINYKGSEEKYYPESIMGMFLNKLKKQFSGLCVDDKDISVSIPDYFTVNERQAMIDAVAISDLKLISLINESSANCLNYGLNRRANFDDKEPRIVAFVDVGQSKTSVFFGQFGKNLQKVISVTNERNLGARDFDYALVEYYSAIFQKKFGCNPLKNKKCIIRLIDVVSKARKILTGNNDSSVSCESLMDDEDLQATLTRSEFEGIIAPFILRLKEVFVRSLADSKMTIDKIHSVEMVGDAVRTPIIQDAIKEIFNKELSKTLAPDESISKGVTLFSALSSPFFNIKDYTFEHYNNNTITFEYPFLKDGQIQIRTHKLLSKGDVFPAKKTIKFTEKQVPNEPILTMKLGYIPEEVPFMKNHYIRTYNIILPKFNTEKFELVLHFVVDTNGIPSIDKATLNEIWYEEAPADKKEEKKEENKMDVDQEVKQIKRERAVMVSLNLVEQNFGLNRNSFDFALQRERQQEKDDIDLKIAHTKRNEIEQFIYNTRQKLDDVLKDYITAEEKPVLLKSMEEMENWFYSEDESVENMEILTSKSHDLDTLGKKIYSRFTEWEKATEGMSKLLYVINQADNKSNEEFTKFNNKDASCYLTLKDIEEIRSANSLYKQKFQEAQNTLSKSIKTDIPLINQITIYQYIDDFTRKINSIYTTAENKWKEEKRKEEEKLKKEKEEKEKAEKAQQDKQKETVEQPKTDNKDINMDVD